MQKPAAYLFAILVGAIIWFFFQHFQLDGVNRVKVVPKQEQGLLGEEGVAGQETPSEKGFRLPRLLPQSNTQDRSVAIKEANLRIPHESDRIRIASFHLHYFGSAVSNKDFAIDILSRVIRNFDIVALQGISSRGPAVVSELTDHVNRTGRKYDFIIGKPASVASQETQFAYLFDTRTIMADRGDGLYTLGDPHGLLRRDPLIGWFRARQAPADDSFTFTLVNIHTDERLKGQELGVLDDVLYEVRDDGRDEDDVILLGCFQGSESHLGELGQVSRLTAVIRGIPTTLDNLRQTENIVFRNLATDEFTGRGGVVDFLGGYNLSMEQAREISDYLPVWAEFSIYEGGQQGRVARRPERN